MKHKKGSAILLTLFLLSGIMVVAFAGSYLVMAGLRSSALQYDSSRAYFAAESGAEYSLRKVRKLGLELDSVVMQDSLLVGTMPSGYPGSFIVDYKYFMPITLVSTGNYGVTRRSVELNF
jgi:hypothetical protein